MRYQSFLLTGLQRGRAAHRPSLPVGTVEQSLTHDTTFTVQTKPYAVLTECVLGHRPAATLPNAWQLKPTAALEDCLPFPWDHTYRSQYKQAFQPVMLWRNTLALCTKIECETDSKKANSTKVILRKLMERMQEFTIEAEGAAWLENRFEYDNDRVLLPAPWVSGIGNAFAILACLRMRKHLPTTKLAQGYARAYLNPYILGQPRPQRWISARDARGYLWLEEYPTPKGRLIHIKNGHIFAVLALHEMSLLDPDAGFAPLVTAGATTIEAYASCLRRPGQTSLYAMNWWNKPDYLPARAIRQLYQLYHLTGAESFLKQGDLFMQDMRAGLSPEDINYLAKCRQLVCERRSAFDTQRDATHK